MRSYGQYCAVARALDVVGDRWTLLIIRELSVQGFCRYTDLRRGLPGIATNLLTARLRDLEQDGLVLREEAPPPIATTLYGLTSRGAALEPVLHALLSWGMPLMVEPVGSDAFRAEWAVNVARQLLDDRRPAAARSAVLFESGTERWHVIADHGKITAKIGPVPTPDATVTGGPREIMGILTGALSLEAARRAGIVIDGDVDAVRRVLPAIDLARVDYPVPPR